LAHSFGKSWPSTDIGFGVAEVIHLEALTDDAGQRYGRFGEKSVISSMT
jgi:hypothetical protein